MRQSSTTKNGKGKAALLAIAPADDEASPLNLAGLTPPADDATVPAEIILTEVAAPLGDASENEAETSETAAAKAETIKAEKARKAEKTDKAEKAEKARKTAADKAEKTDKAEKRASDTAARVKAETKADERATAEVAAMFKALGDPTRLRILRYLRADSASGNSDGVIVGDVALHLACLAGTPARKATSTLSHHLKELRHAGLVTMERRGKNVACAVSPNAVEKLQQALGAADTSLAENKEPAS